MGKKRWEAILDQVKASIMNGELIRGQHLPSETEFAAEWQISRTTAHRILSELQALGLVDRRPRAGTVVSMRRNLKTVAVLIHETRMNPQASYLHGISEGLSHNYNLLLCDTRDSAAHEAQLLEGIAERADGVIIFPTANPENTELLARVAKIMPLVCIDRVPDALAVDAVVADEYASSLEGMHILTGRGHRRIAHFTNDSLHVTSVRERLDAYLTTLSEVGTLQTRWLRTITDHDIPFWEFAELVHRALASMMSAEEPPTALFCLHDDYMSAALASCERLKLRVPEDLEILSVNDSPMLPIFRIEQVHRIVPRTVELGRVAAERVIALAAWPDSAPVVQRLRSVVIPAEWASPQEDCNLQKRPSGTKPEGRYD